MTFASISSPPLLDMSNSRGEPSVLLYSDYSSSRALSRIYWRASVSIFKGATFSLRFLSHSFELFTRENKP